jgi:hypothetical protein
MNADGSKTMRVYCSSNKHFMDEKDDSPYKAVLD